MTLRGYLLRRQLLASVICAVVCVLLALLLFQIADPATHRYSAYAIVALAIALMPVQWLVRAHFVRCPKCRASLGIRGIGARRVCPVCQVRFDDPWP
jgi:membrane-associated PAP2 superfamily phosphatase